MGTDQPVTDRAAPQALLPGNCHTQQTQTSGDIMILNINYKIDQSSYGSFTVLITDNRTGKQLIADVELGTPAEVQQIYLEWSYQL